MTILQHPDRSTLEDWLQHIHVDHFLCGECEGLHLSALQDIEGVVNSRIFVHKTHVLITTELEIRPMAVLPMASDLGRINMDYPGLKVFLDIVDDETPQLVASASMLATAGIAQKQFGEFVVNVMDGTRLLAEECLQLDYLFARPESPGISGSTSVH